MSIALMLVRSDLSQVEVPVRHSPEILGRHTDCKVRLPDASVSRQHCEISVDGDKVSIRDLGSSNGTYVNGKKVTTSEVRAGDVLTIGKFIFVLRVNNKPETIDSADALEDGEVVMNTAPQPASTTKAQKPAKAAGGAKAGGKAANLDDSSVMDFDFLDDDDGPKL